jgi:hypothetical protein
MSAVELVLAPDTNSPGLPWRRLELKGTTYNPHDGGLVEAVYGKEKDPAMGIAAIICALCNDSTVEYDPDNALYKAVREQQEPSPPKVALIEDFCN